MARTARWTEGKLSKGVIEVTFSSWKWFSDYVNQELLDYTTYIYRGHNNSSWKLESTLDRASKSVGSFTRATHLENFLSAVRGRRGRNPLHFTDPNEWWALGQHHGLWTPLLDWTESPFVALYFAILGTDPSRNCCVWALAVSAVDRNNERIKTDDSIEPVEDLTKLLSPISDVTKIDTRRKPIVEVVEPRGDENGRLVNQRGLFTRAPDNMDIEQWIRKYSADDRYYDLIKLVIPKSGAKDCLRYLNRMNINHATLFPDLYGASQFCNMELEITDY